LRWVLDRSVFHLKTYSFASLPYKKAHPCRLRFREDKDESRLTPRSAKDYQSQAYAFVDALAVSIADLQVVERVALLCGLAAAVLKEVR
jgi:hypothetical protein